jgi:hypothetical protein
MPLSRCGQMIDLGLSMRRVSLLLAAALVAAPALADDKKKSKDQGNFDDLFGAPPAAPSGVDAMKKATEGVGAKTVGDGLAPKVGSVDNDAGVTFLNVFAAEKIITDKKLGCQPGGRSKTKVSNWSFDEIPAKANQGFEVCLTMHSKAGREMNMSVAIVDTRNQKVAKAEDVVDFRGRVKIDHVLEYPAPLFKSAGQYFYVIDLDGKEVARMPLFAVKLDGGAQPATAKDPGDK